MSYNITHRHFEEYNSTGSFCIAIIVFFIYVASLQHLVSLQELDPVFFSSVCIHIKYIYTYNVRHVCHIDDSTLPFRCNWRVSALVRLASLASCPTNSQCRCVVSSSLPHTHITYASRRRVVTVVVAVCDMTHLPWTRVCDRNHRTLFALALALRRRGSPAVCA